MAQSSGCSPAGTGQGAVAEQRRVAAEAAVNIPSPVPALQSGSLDGTQPWGSGKEGRRLKWMVPSALSEAWGNQSHLSG